VSGVRSSECLRIKYLPIHITSPTVIVDEYNPEAQMLAHNHLHLPSLLKKNKVLESEPRAIKEGRE
jgi:hypothetical protein